MKTIFAALFGLAAALLAPIAAAQVTLYEQQGFYGRTFTATGPIYNLDRYGFNDLASSIIIDGGDWEVCENSDFRGRCIFLHPGQYPSLASLNFGNRISSLRRVSPGPNYVFASPPPVPVPYTYYPHHEEPLYTADVVAVRAVMGPPEQRCWIEREQVSTPSQPNVPGAILGGILGGVIGHQFGSGRGNDVATGVGAVAGAAVGANVNKSSGGTTTQDVQKCTTVAGTGKVQYWDVTYVFQGITHRAQLAFAPGATITVNANGEPRA